MYFAVDLQTFQPDSCSHKSYITTQTHKLHCPNNKNEKRLCVRGRERGEGSVSLTNYIFQRTDINTYKYKKVMSTYYNKSMSLQKGEILCIKSNSIFPTPALQKQHQSKAKQSKEGFIMLCHAKDNITIFVFCGETQVLKNDRLVLFTTHVITLIIFPSLYKPIILLLVCAFYSNYFNEKSVDLEE